MADGIFTQPSGGGVFRDDGLSPQNDPAAPPIDSDGTPLRETLVVVYPSPGHMRVARAIRHPQSGRVEYQEELRVPTQEEVNLLAQQGVTVGPGSMVTNDTGARMPGINGGPSQMPRIGEVAPSGQAVAASGTPWVKLLLALGAGAAGLWAVNKWVVPKVGDFLDGGGDEPRTNGDDDDDDGDD